MIRPYDRRATKGRRRRAARRARRILASVDLAVCMAQRVVLETRWCAAWDDFSAAVLSGLHRRAGVSPCA